MNCPECGGPWNESISSFIHQPGCGMGRYEAAPFPPCGGGSASATGWICPKCGNGISPWQSTCPVCSSAPAEPKRKPGLAPVPAYGVPMPPTEDEDVDRR